jgi:hypothetical protein
MPRTIGPSSISPSILLKYHRPFVELDSCRKTLPTRYYDIRQETRTHQNYRLYGLPAAKRLSEVARSHLQPGAAVERYGAEEVERYWGSGTARSSHWKGSIGVPGASKLRRWLYGLSGGASGRLAC